MTTNRRLVRTDLQTSHNHKASQLSNGGKSFVILARPEGETSNSLAERVFITLAEWTDYLQTPCLSMERTPLVSILAVTMSVAKGGFWA